MAIVLPAQKVITLPANQISDKAKVRKITRKMKIGMVFTSFGTKGKDYKLVKRTKSFLFFDSVNQKYRIHRTRAINLFDLTGI